MPTNIIYHNSFCIKEQLYIISTDFIANALKLSYFSYTREFVLK